MSCYLVRKSLPGKVVCLLSCLSMNLIGLSLPGVTGGGARYSRGGVEWSGYR